MILAEGLEFLEAGVKMIPDTYTEIDEEAAKKWLQTGAQPTETVAKLFKQAGIEK